VPLNQAAVADLPIIDFSEKIPEDLKEEAIREEDEEDFTLPQPRISITIKPENIEEKIAEEMSEIAEEIRETASEISPDVLVEVSEEDFYKNFYI